MKWEDIISSLSTCLDVFSLAKGSPYVQFQNIFSLLDFLPDSLTLGPFFFIASPSRQLCSYRAMAGHFKISVENTKRRISRTLVTKLLGTYFLNLPSCCVLCILKMIIYYVFELPKN